MQSCINFNPFDVVLNTDSLVQHIEHNIYDILIEYNFKLQGHIDISQYEILSLFIVTNYTRVSKNIILYYTIVTQIMSLYSILIDINKKKGNYAGDHYH